MSTVLGGLLAIILLVSWWQHVLRKWYHKRTHMFYLGCKWCERDEYRMNLLVEFPELIEGHKIDPTGGDAQWVPPHDA